MVFFISLEQRKATYLKPCFFSTFFFSSKSIYFIHTIRGIWSFRTVYFSPFATSRGLQCRFFISESEMTNNRPIFHSRHEMVIICEHLIDNPNLIITLILFWSPSWGSLPELLSANWILSLSKWAVRFWLSFYITVFLNEKIFRLIRWIQNFQ